MVFLVSYLDFQQGGDVLAAEILSNTSGLLYLILWILFAITFIVGIFALIDFLFRIFNTTAIDKLNDLVKYLEENFS